jgi:hypothetical protein
MTRGAAHVRAQIKARGLKQNDAARLVSCDSGNFSRLLTLDNRTPGRALASRIREVFGTAIESWDEKIPDEEAAAMLAAVESPPDSQPTPSPHDSGELPAVEPGDGTNG